MTIGWLNDTPGENKYQFRIANLSIAFLNTLLVRSSAFIDYLSGLNESLFCRLKTVGRYSWSTSGRHDAYVLDSAFCANGFFTRMYVSLLIEATVARVGVQKGVCWKNGEKSLHLRLKIFTRRMTALWSGWSYLEFIAPDWLIFERLAREKLLNRLFQREGALKPVQRLCFYYVLDSVCGLLFWIRCQIACFNDWIGLAADR